MLLYNTYSQKKEVFTPITPGNVRIYVCGITPYDTTHLGHAFTYTSYDALIRYLRYKGYKVNYVQNVTDIDDDILKRAKETHRNWQDLGEFWTNKFLSDLKTLNIQMPSHYVKATDAIETIVAMTKRLILKGYAYEREGNVYFSVKSSKDYGKLSKFTRKQMLLISQERGGDTKDTRKKDPLDFLLWQKSAQDEPRWESPWGKGRPGWHIECSAMIRENLGDQIDIHGGGKDLIYPHHESEIAQSESYTGKKPFVRYWLHVGMLMYQGEKMSKSLGNLVMADDLAEKYSPRAVRWILLSHHYRLPWEYFVDDMKEAQKIIQKINKATSLRLNGKGTVDRNVMQEVEGYMDDDLNTPRVLALAQSLAEKILKEKDVSSQVTLKQLLLILGFSFQ